MKNAKLFSTFAFISLLGLQAADAMAATAPKASLPKPSVAKKVAVEPTTRSDAVIFKIHDIEPVLEDGVVKGCNYMVTLYNRTSINFRTFTLNLSWPDVVDERFKFDKYVESILGVEAAEKEKEIFGKNNESKPTQTAITVNAFGADKQISLHSYMNNEKCYLMLSEANYSVTPCDIARSASEGGSFGGSTMNNDCTSLFQLVSSKNPEYFGEFKRISATEEASLNATEQSRELSEIDVVIGKIVENMGVSDQTLSGIN